MALTLKNIIDDERLLITADDPNGNFKASDPPGSLNGTPVKAAWGRDVWAFLERLMAYAEISHNGFSDSQNQNQRFEALLEIIRNRAVRWADDQIYDKSIIVLADNDQLYQSLLDNNLNNYPPTSYTTWREFPAVASDSVKGISYLHSQVILSRIGAQQINAAAGTMNFDDGTGQVLTTTINKNVNLIWSEGNYGGGLDTGAIAADALYYFYAIYNPTTANVDYMMTLNFGAPQLPSGYTKKEYKGFLATDHSKNIYDFTQVYDEMHWKSPIEEFSGTVSDQLIAVTAPKNSIIFLTGLVSTCQVDISIHDPNAITFFVNLAARYSSGDWSSADTIYLPVMTDELSQIKMDVVSGSGSAALVNYAIRDLNLKLI